jgi:hypothetical protein
MAIHLPPPDSPRPTLWTGVNRGDGETALDCETAVSLACHVIDAFDRAQDWTGLIIALAKRGFGLEFEGDRLILVNDGTGVSLCTCRFLGHGLASLTARFGKPRVLATSGRLIADPDRDI